MNRTLLIAHREVMAYVKTWGFWLSLFSLPVFAVLGGFVPVLMRQAEPVHAYVIVDESQAGDLATGVRQVLAQDYERSVLSAMATAAIPEAGVTARDAVYAAGEAGGYEAGLAELKKLAPRAGATFKNPRQKQEELEAPAELLNAATPEARDALAREWVQKEDGIDGRPLSAVVILSEKEGQPSARVWDRRANGSDLETVIRDALSETYRHKVFAENGIDRQLVQTSESFRPDVTLLSPRAASGGEVGMRDRLPSLIGMLCGFLMWSLILTGASMLMNGVMEEKSNKILEVLLSSVTATELLAGKVLGVAILTLTVMGGWSIISAISLSIAMPDVAQDIFAVLITNGLWLYLLIYLIGGYLMYAVLFAAIGAFCETPREAQVLMGPVMIAMIIPLLFMQMALRSPDAVILKVMSMIPPFTPFLMAARAPSQPPMVEVIGSILIMFAFAALMMWLSGRAFRAGAMSDAKLSWQSFLSAMRSQ